MILAIDAGNTNIKFGIFEGEQLKHSWRLATSLSRTSDEYGMFFIDLLSSAKLGFGDIDGIIISSVIPGLNYTLTHMCRDYAKQEPLMVSAATKTGLTIKYDNPDELGSDRIISSAAAYRIYGAPVIVADFGTATTFNVISGKGEFLGGAIAPGLKMSMEALSTGTARLPRIELSRPSRAVGTSTGENLRSGLIFGLASLTEGIIARMKAESAIPDARVVATGGISELIREVTTVIDTVDRQLTLKGLNYIYSLNMDI